MSQKQVATTLGLPDTSSLSRWEKGEGLPNLVNLFKLSKLYKALPNEMYFDLWQAISKNIATGENDLLTLPESFANNNVYQL